MGCTKFLIQLGWTHQFARIISTNANSSLYTNVLQISILYNSSIEFYKIHQKHRQHHQPATYIFPKSFPFYDILNKFANMLRKYKMVKSKFCATHFPCTSYFMSLLGFNFHFTIRAFYENFKNFVKRKHEIYSTHFTTSWIFQSVCFFSFGCRLFSCCFFFYLNFSSSYFGSI